MVEIDVRSFIREVISPAILALMFMAGFALVLLIILMTFGANPNNLVSNRDIFWCIVLLPTASLLIALRGRI